MTTSIQCQGLSVTQKGRIEVFLPRTADGVSLRESWAYMW